MVNLYLTDPPYNVAYGYDGAATEGHRKDGLVVLNDKMDNDKFEEFLTNAFNAANANMEKVLRSIYSTAMATHFGFVKPLSIR